MNRKIMWLNQISLMGILRGSVVIENLSEDAEIVGIQFEFSSGNLEVILQHESFDPVELGNRYPVFMAELRTI